MAEIQDEDQWLYGEDKEEESADRKKNETNATESESKKDEHKDAEPDNTESVGVENAETNGDVAETLNKDDDENVDGEKKGDKSKDGDDDSSSDDEPTVTIGKIVKQPDIMRPPPPTHRAAPTSGLKDEDFTSVGKINGVPATDYNLAELEDKPWRKPGADLSDYFNYGFTEETWIKYCERQKVMRTNESGIGLNSLGINVGKGALGSVLSSNIPVSMNEKSKYGGLRKPAGMPIVKSNSMDEDSMLNAAQTNTVNTIQVMTADRRTYSNKVMAGGTQGSTYEEVDFGGNPYGNDFFNTPPPNFYTPPPPTGPWGGVPNVPPPGWTPEGGIGGPPPPMGMHRGGAMGFFEEEGGFGRQPGRSNKDEREMEKIRESIVESRERGDREPRHHRRRSRSRSKSRHRRRSKSRSPSSHKHKRKKSKRERETE